MARLLRFLRRGARQKRDIAQNVPGHLGIVETSRMLLSAKRQVLAQARVCDEPPQAIGKESLGVLSPVIEDQPRLAVCHKVAEAAKRGHHDGAAGRHGLGHGYPERLALLGDAWIAKDVHPPEEARKGLRAEFRTQPLNAASK